MGGVYEGAQSDAAKGGGDTKLRSRPSFRGHRASGDIAFIEAGSRTGPGRRCRDIPRRFEFQAQNATRQPSAGSQRSGAPRRRGRPRHRPPGVARP